MTIINISIFKYIIPEIFFIMFLFFFILFLLFLSNSKIYNYSLINSITSYLTAYFFVFLFLLYINNIEYSLYTCNNILFFSNGLNYIKSLIILLIIFLILISIQYNKEEKFNDFEQFILFIFSVFGILLLLSTNDFLITYIAIELQSLVFYVLVSLKKNTIFSTESGLKYFVLGSLASLILLFGFSLIYYIFGTLNFNELYLLNIYFNLNAYYTILLIISILIILCGLFIKLSIIPFHFWSPDVYEGSSTNITIYISLIPKISFLIFFIRLIFFVFNFYSYIIYIFILFLSILSIFGGTFLSLKQKKIKRLFIYSSIVHVGFLIISILTGTFLGLQAFIIYLIFYLFLSLNIWFIYISLRIKKTNTLITSITHLNSLFYTNPVLSNILILNLFSIAGIPPFAGFWAKYLVFLALIDIKFYFFAVIIIFISSISVFYYLKIIKNIYFTKNKTHLHYISFKPISQVNILIIVILFLFTNFFLVLYPDFLIVLSRLIIYSFFF